MRKPLTEFRIGEYGEYIDECRAGVSFHRVQVPASVGLAMVMGLVASYGQVGVESRVRTIDRSLPALDDQQKWELVGGCAVTIRESGLDVGQSLIGLMNKGFLCVGATGSGRVFVYKHDFSWYVVTVTSL